METTVTNTITNIEPNCLPPSHTESLQKLTNNYWWQSGRVSWASSFIKQYKNKNKSKQNSYADLGCGSGLFSKSIAKQFQFSKCILADGDPKFLNSLKLENNMKTTAINLEQDWKLPIEPDVITCMDVIEHVKNDSKVINNIYKALPKNGLLILSVPAHQNLYSDWDVQLKHYRRYNRKQLVTLLKKSGFQINQASYMWSFLAPVGLWRKYRKANEEIDFPKVSKLTNFALKTASKCEWTFNRFCPTPFGTTLIVSAYKK